MSTRDDRSLLADMNHELLSPLNAIIGSSDVLLEKYFGDLTARQETFVRDIRESGARLLALINDLLELGRPDAEERTSDTDVAALLRTTVTLVTERALKHRVRITVAVRDLAPTVASQPTALRKALFFLVSDGVAHASDGGAVAIELSGDVEAVVLTVRSGVPGADEGSAIPDATRVRAIVERLGGTLVADAVGAARVLTLRLPRAM